MSATFRLFFFFLLFLSTLEIYPQIRIHKNNQFDAECRKHGRWVTFSENDPLKKTYKGWYDHGSETKRCTYYNNGIRWAKFRYVNDTLIRLKRYDSNGNLEYKGRALWMKNQKEMRFCWDGEFTFYDSHRRRIKKVMYVMGEEQGSE